MAKTKKRSKKQPEKQKDKSFAIASFVCGLLIWVPLFNAILGIMAVILGVLAIKRVKKYPELYGGQGLALTGIILGTISIIFVLTWAFIRIFKPELLVI